MMTEAISKMSTLKNTKTSRITEKDSDGRNFLFENIDRMCTKITKITLYGYLFVICLCLSLFVFLSSLFLWQGYYVIHDSNFVHENTPYPLLLDSTRATHQANIVQDELLDSLYTGREFGLVELSERENLHMIDVVHLMRTLFRFGIDFLIGFIFLMSIFILHKDYFASFAQIDKSRKVESEKNEGRFWVSKKTLAIGLVCAGFIASLVLWFNDLFVFFHRISFSNDLWILPYDSFLIQTFPIGFFLYSFVMILFLAAVLFFLGLFMLRSHTKLAL
jgi:uncharacterized membrane protein